MRVKALKSFSGLITAYEGLELEITNDAILKDLLKAGYVEEVKTSEGTKGTEKSPKPKKPRKAKEK